MIEINRKDHPYADRLFVELPTQSSPGCSPMASRIDFGTVTWPLAFSLESSNPPLLLMITNLAEVVQALNRADASHG